MCCYKIFGKYIKYLDRRQTEIIQKPMDGVGADKWLRSLGRVKNNKYRPRMEINTPKMIENLIEKR